MAPAGSSAAQEARSESGMTRECLSEIWSLYRHAEVVVRISYRVRQAGNCRIFRLGRVQEVGN